MDVAASGRISLVLARLQHSAGPNDPPDAKQDAVEELRALTASHAKELGMVALPQIVDLVCEEKDADVVQGLLEVLSALVESGSSSALINTEFLLQDGGVMMEKLLQLLGHGDMWVRFNTIALLQLLAALALDWAEVRAAAFFQRFQLRGGLLLDLSLAQWLEAIKRFAVIGDQAPADRHQ